MKNYSTPAMVALNVNVENAILAGSPSAGMGEGTFPTYWYNDGNGNISWYQLIDGKYYQYNPETKQPNIAAGGLDQLPWMEGIL